MTTPLIPQNDFNEITQLIHAARQRAVQAVNTALIELYWQVGQLISRKIELERVSIAFSILEMRMLDRI